jgi:hypothetical protein
MLSTTNGINQSPLIIMAVVPLENRVSICSPLFMEVLGGTSCSSNQLFVKATVSMPIGLSMSGALRSALRSWPPCWNRSGIQR